MVRLFYAESDAKNSSAGQLSCKDNPGSLKSDAGTPTLRRVFKAVLTRRYAAEMGRAARCTRRRNARV